MTSPEMKLAAEKRRFVDALLDGKIGAAKYPTKLNFRQENEEVRDYLT